MLKQIDAPGCSFWQTQLTLYHNLMLLSLGHWSNYGHKNEINLNWRQDKRLPRWTLFWSIFVHIIEHWQSAPFKLHFMSLGFDHLIQVLYLRSDGTKFQNFTWRSYICHHHSLVQSELFPHQSVSTERSRHSQNYHRNLWNNRPPFRSLQEIPPKH